VSSLFPEHLDYRSNDDYLEEFMAFAQFVKARYAIPFASNHCYLHRDTKQFNTTVVTPQAVKEYFDLHNSSPTVCTVMLAGDSWSTEHGFSLTKTDYFTNRAEHLEELERGYRDKLESSYVQEEKVLPDWGSFNRYFSALLAALPTGYGFLQKARILYHVTGNGEAWWLVDFNAHKIVQSAEPTVEHDIRLDVSAKLRDCCRKKMFSSFTASKRLHYHLKTRPAYRYLRIYNITMDMYERDYFPLYRIFRLRFLADWLKRWREVAFYIAMLVVLCKNQGKFRPIEYMKRA
jgi:UDP-MurNAc hydroxylase